MNAMQGSFLADLTGSFSQGAASNPTVDLMEAGYAAAAIPCRYVNCEVAPADLPDAVRGAVAMGWLGFNCSIPHKVAVVSLVDDLAPSAAIIGAVNTVIIRNGHLTGENTDGQGFLASLRQVIDPRGTRLLILGAGGAARAIAVECALAGASEVTIVNRGAERGMALAELVSARTPAASNYLPWSPRLALPSDVDVVINATSIGFAPDTASAPDVDFGTFRPTMVVADVVANPPQTRWLTAAAAAGCTTVNGLGMLVNQACINARLWTGVDCDPAVMRRELIRLFNLDEEPPH